MFLSSRFNLILGFIFAMFSVALGAFAAHSLKTILDLKSLNNFETGVKYQFYHAFALLIIGMLQKLYEFPSNKFKTAGFLFLLGIVFFSGSLYLLSLNSILHIPTIILGPITPLGGLLLISGWIVALLGVLESK